jgi:cytoskeletal protein CcmA (bactofilin family)
MEAPQDNNELNSLEDQDTTVEEKVTNSNSAADESANQAPVKKKQGLFQRAQSFIFHLNIYLLVFILIVVLASGVVFVGVQRNKKEAAPPVINTQELSLEELEKIAGNQTKVGDPRQILNIESNAIFSGNVLVRDSLDVAGTLRIGGALNLPGITVAGTSNFDQIQANSLGITGDTNIQGQLNIQRTLTVGGGATFGGAISAPSIVVENLQITGNLQIPRHIDGAGPSPGITPGGALGAGGTTSLSGSDTAGSINVNIGGGPSTGCFATITFAQRFGGTPHVVVTPVGAGAANLNYYINRTPNGFSLCTANAAPAGTSFSFNYIAIDETVPLNIEKHDHVIGLDVHNTVGYTDALFIFFCPNHDVTRV